MICFVKYLCIAVLAASICAASGTTHYAPNASLSAVQATVTAASSGDTIIIPAGSYFWSGRCLINKPLTIQGSGTNLTVLSGYGFEIRVSVDDPVRVSDIAWVQSNWSIDGIFSIVGGPCKQIRIDHCYFYRGSHIIYTAVTWSTLPLYGLIDHNRCHDVNIFLFASAVDYVDDNPSGYIGDCSWSLGSQTGTTNTWVVEDNYFTFSSVIQTSPNNNNNQILYEQNGGRAVFRSNRVEAPEGNPSMIDIHPGDCQNGPGHGGSSSYRSTPLIEVYSNVFCLNASSQPVDIRGGRSLWHDNEFWVTNNPTCGVVLWDEPNVWGCTPYDRITNTFFWRNTWNGAAFPSTLPDNPTYPFSPVGSVNVNYFMHEPTAGQFFYPYAQLSYPHPMLDPQTEPLMSLSESRVYFEIGPGETTNLSIVIQNVGGGTLSGTAYISPSPIEYELSGETTYNLGAGETATITITYSPSDRLRHITTVTCTGAQGAIVPVSGWTPAMVIWPLGDSLTSGRSSPEDVPGGYRLFLYQMLTNRGTNLVYVGSMAENAIETMEYNEHDGWPGYEIGPIDNPWTQTGGIFESYQSWSAGLRTPQAILLFAGLNDFRHNEYDVATLSSNRLEALIESICLYFPSSKLYVASVNVWNPAVTTYATDLDNYLMRHVTTICARQRGLGRSAYPVDLRGEMTAAVDVCEDNVHLTEAGYLKLAQGFYDALIGEDPIVNSPPTITLDPESQTVVLGGQLILTGGAIGTEPLSFLWTKGGTAISGSTTTAYVVNGVAESHAGDYRFIATNAWGYATSAAATVTIAVPAEILSVNPEDTNVIVGANVVLNVAIYGTAPVDAYWLKDAVVVGSGTNLTLSNIQLTDAGEYYPRATNAWGIAEAGPVVVTVTEAGTAPVVVVSPSSQSVTVGYPASFSATVTGTQPFTYQWQLFGTNLPGATTTALELVNVQLTSTGDYYCWATNAYGTGSDYGTLSVSQAPAPYIGLGTPLRITR